MRRFLIALSFAVLTVLPSCRQEAEKGRDTIPFVKAVVSDTDGPEHSMLSGMSKVPSSGDIYVIGSAESCKLMGQKFIECDVIENARGRQWSDDLKDFAGETFSCICDQTFAPYKAFYDSFGSDCLREAAVRLALSSLSPKCSVSIFDVDGNLSKTPAKMIILADPWLVEYGKFDIDTLFTMTSCGVPVISPEDLGFEALLGGGKKYFNIGILGDSLYVGKGLYPAMFCTKTSHYDVVGARMFEAASVTLAGFLDSYAEAGNTEPLDALLVDDWNTDVAAMKTELAGIRDFSREESMKYGKFLSPDFVIFSVPDITMSACYRLLRERGMFTHRIAQPQVRNFVARPRPDGAEMQFLLIPSDNVQD